MTNDNGTKWKIKGTIDRIRNIDAKVAMVSWTVKSGDKAWFDGVAFRDAATTIGGAGQGAIVTLSGHLEKRKPQNPADKVWPLQLVCDDVKIEKAAVADEDIPF